jgi:hypothetical protein
MDLPLMSHQILLELVIRPSSCQGAVVERNWSSPGNLVEDAEVHSLKLRLMLTMLIDCARSSWSGGTFTRGGTKWRTRGSEGATQFRPYTVLCETLKGSKSARWESSHKSREGLIIRIGVDKGRKVRTQRVKSSSSFPFSEICSLSLFLSHSFFPSKCC